MIQPYASQFVAAAHKPSPPRVSCTIRLISLMSVPATLIAAGNGNWDGVGSEPATRMTLVVLELATSNPQNHVLLPKTYRIVSRSSSEPVNLVTSRNVARSPGHCRTMIGAL